MDDQAPQQLFEELTKGLPRFEDGRINFRGASRAPVLNAVLCYEGNILIVKRSEKVGSYQGLWNGVSGFIDEPKPIEDFVRQELREELSLDEKFIQTIKLARPYEVDDRKINRVWVVYPALVALSQKPTITLDWEHTEFAWINPDQLTQYKHVKDLDKSVSKALNLIID